MLCWKIERAFKKEALRTTVRELKTELIRQLSFFFNIYCHCINIFFVLRCGLCSNVFLILSCCRNAPNPR